MTQYVICALQMEGFHCWPEAAYRYYHRAVSSESLSGAVEYSFFLFLHEKCRPPLTASCSVRSVFRLPV